MSAAPDLNIDTPEKLEAWLADKPVEWAQVIAARAAAIAAINATLDNADNYFTAPIRRR